MSDSKVTVPLWTIVDEAKQSQVGLPTSMAIFERPPLCPGDFFALFITEQLAAEFIAASSLAANVPFCLESRKDVQFIVEAVKLLPGGNIYAAFNPEYNKHGISGKFYDLDAAIELVVEANPNGNR